MPLFFIIARAVQISSSAWQQRRNEDYLEEFDYLVSSGSALEVKAISAPTYPLIENSGGNLLKLYLNDAGILSIIYYRNNIKAVMPDRASVNLGSIYKGDYPHSHLLYHVLPKRLPGCRAVFRLVAF